MRGSCIECPDPPPPVRLAIGLVILAFNLLVMLGPPVLIGMVMDMVGDLQMFRGIGMMAASSNEEIQAFYEQLGLMTLDFSYERAQFPTAQQYRWILAHRTMVCFERLAFNAPNRCRPHSSWAAGVQWCHL